MKGGVVMVSQVGRLGGFVGVSGVWWGVILRWMFGWLSIWLFFGTFVGVGAIRVVLVFLGVFRVFGGWKVMVWCKGGGQGCYGFWGVDWTFFCGGGNLGFGGMWVCCLYLWNGVGWSGERGEEERNAGGAGVS
uniref:Transmembrane protein n=1 Tax=Knipowitschia caucasica TaxID=637954 RepID=A0AAV2KXM2_KNICA